MRALRRGNSTEFLPRALLSAVLAGFLVFSSVAGVHASLLPEDFFDISVKPGEGAAAVEADRLSYDGTRDVISADGNVVFSYQGFVIKTDKLEYNQQTGKLSAIGNVVMRDPGGNVYQMSEFEVTGGMKEAFLNSLTLTTEAGAVITADDAHYMSELQTVLTNAAYSPCGLCIDSKGRRIGWKVKSARIIYDRENASVTLEQPSLELLGIPVAWLPWFWVPDPTQPRARGLRMPSVNYDPELGATLTVPYFVPVGENVDFILSPMLMSRQGALMAADLTWRWPSVGEIDIKASGLYQLDRSAFAGTVGDLDWRGAIQTSGRFTPLKNWRAGWSYSVFTDNAYLKDYGFSDADSSTNQAYTTYLDDQTWFDARVQKFNRLGDYTAAADAKQGLNVPLVQLDHVQQLPRGMGQLRIDGTVRGVHRETDSTGTVGGVPYVYGFAGNKAHGKVEAAWEDQFILPGGFAATPYLGLRLDGAWYDGGSSNASAPASSYLLSATPIAAMDLRWPLMATNGSDTHLLEPIAQLVYRSSSTTLTGITDDDSHSFVLDASNLFSYNRFSGIDRQETGLRANIGGHYLANFGNGSWLDFVAGESFQLAGLNALGVTDPAQVGTSTGMGSAASYIVASLQGGVDNGISGGASVQIDPATWSVKRAGLGVDYSDKSWFWGGLDYTYIAADPSLGTLKDQHEIAGNVGIPVFDYWSLTAGLTYDIGGMSWAKAKAGVIYDDGYLRAGLTGSATPTSWGFGVHFGLKGPDGEIAF